MIDTASNEVLSTKTWLEGIPSRQPGMPKRFGVGFSARMVAGTGEGALAVVSSDFRSKIIFRELEIFTNQASQPAFTIRLTEQVNDWMLSKDETLLFAAFGGEKGIPGSLGVIDMAKGTITHQSMNGTPFRLVRLGPELDPWVLGSEEMRSITERGELGDRRISLSKQATAAEAEDSNEGEPAFLNGYPGEALSVGGDHAAILISNRNGSSRHRMALIDLKKLQIDGIIPTMSGGEIAGKRTKRYFAAFGLSMATGGSLIFIPNMTMRNEALAAAPDGHKLYALDVEGHEVTVVDVDTAAVVTRLKVNNSILRLQVSLDGKHLLCFGSKTQVIDIASNKLLVP